MVQLIDGPNSIEVSRHADDSSQEGDVGRTRMQYACVVFTSITPIRSERGRSKRGGGQFAEFDGAVRLAAASNCRRGPRLPWERETRPDGPRR